MHSPSEKAERLVKRLKRRPILLIGFLAITAVMVNIVLFVYIQYIAEVRSTKHFLEAQQKIISSDVIKYLDDDNSFGIFTLITRLTSAVPHLDNIAVYNSKGLYMADGRVERDTITPDSSNIVFRMPIVDAAGEHLGTMEFFVSRTSIVAGIVKNISALALLNLLIIVAGLLTGVYLSQRMTKPIADFSKLQEENKQKHETRMENLTFGLAQELAEPIEEINRLTDTLERQGVRNQEIMSIRSETFKLAERIGEFVEYSMPVKVAISEMTLSELADFIRAKSARYIRKNLITAVHCPEDVSVSIDKTKFGKIIAILQTNSLDAGAKNAVITLSVVKKGIEAVYEDDGTGFGDADMDKLFLPYYTTKSDGSGLGLAVCAVLAEAMGAEISASNGDTAGVKFRIVIPSEVKELT
ncbi:sensor histidine kinase [Seleniivibrio woodruffii]|uniref:histidine kinase n=1 Tax=Seleniivibrio woodruffii TaxID=1078050 RepID=A0A4R1K6W3_9BACT|nr:HAMP domain-containing sensor histidine kinase [Seleniivibrio woodruffii]TCK59995.1 signal transduction histidine kinase [Seleniivibrio woodruffii]TVZ35784.1 signal transduction histidine kinase [Seleniivibrio woodruffii]